MPDEEQALVDRLKVSQRDGRFDPVPGQLLRKYVGYARKYVHPDLSDGAAEVLQVLCGGLASAVWLLFRLLSISCRGSILSFEGTDRVLIAHPSLPDSWSLSYDSLR